jgi:hypothetical protein
LVRVDTFSSTKLQTNIPSVPSQATEPPDDNNQEDEYGMADDSIIDADLEVSSTIGDAQEAEIVGAVQKDPPTRPRMKPFNPSAWSDGHCPHAARSHSFVYISTSYGANVIRLLRACS